MLTMPGTIVDERVRSIRWHRVADRLPGARCYEARVHDGILFAVVGHEQTTSGNRPLWHLSISHRERIEATREVFSRTPTWDEIKHAKYSLVPADVAMSVFLPQKGAPYCDDHPTTLHAWEVDGELCL